MDYNFLNSKRNQAYYKRQESSIITFQKIKPIRSWTQLPALRSDGRGDKNCGAR